MLGKDKRHPRHESMGSFGGENTDNEKSKRTLELEDCR